MVEAFAASGTKRPLVLVGGLGWQYDRDVETLNDERFHNWHFDGERIRAERSVKRLPMCLSAPGGPDPRRPRRAVSVDL